MARGSKPLREPWELGAQQSQDPNPASRNPQHPAVLELSYSFSQPLVTLTTVQQLHVTRAPTAETQPAAGEAKVLCPSRGSELSCRSGHLLRRLQERKGTPGPFPPRSLPNCSPGTFFLLVWRPTSNAHPQTGFQSFSARATRKTQNWPR